jgi:hypothetical protein
MLDLQHTGNFLVFVCVLFTTYPIYLPAIWFGGFNTFLALVGFYFVGAEERMKNEIEGLAQHQYRYKRV